MKHIDQIQDYFHNGLVSFFMSRAPYKDSFKFFFLGGGNEITILNRARVFWYGVCKMGSVVEVSHV